MEKKNKVRRQLRRWRKGKGEGERYRTEKKEYKELCEKKKKKEEKRLMREIGEARTEGKVWEITTRERRKRKGVNEEIQMRVWKEHFKGLLEGNREERVRRGKESKGRKAEEEELKWKEMRKVIDNLKLNKAVGGDGIPNEVWKYEEKNWKNG